MIRKSKYNENKPDFDVMFNEVQEEIQEKDAEQDIISRVPELKQLSSDIDKATTAVINAKLSLESSIRQTQREEGVLNNEGVWLSQRLFYIIGSLSLLSIITIVLEIAFYVYFHWILKKNCLYPSRFRKSV